MLSQPQLNVVAQVLLAVLVAVAAVYDIRFRRIPNWLVLAGFIAGLSVNIVLSGWSGLGEGAEGFGLGLVLYLPLYFLRARGAGDVKLLAAAGSITGPGNCFWIFLLTAILGGLIAVVYLMMRGRMGKTLFNVRWIVKDLMQFKAPYRSSDELDVTSSKGTRLPHGLMMAVGVVAFLALVHYQITI